MNNFARPGLGATELPPVNSEDNGKVLGVSDGAWAKVAASGGSDLPDDPAQDGTYNLQNTVSSGTGTLSWASGGSSGGGVLVVHDVEGTLDKTWQEIWDAAGTGPAYVLISDSGEREWDLITSVLTNTHNAHRLSTASGVFYDAESANDYPVLSE